MESLEAISAMNEKHPPGRRSTSIADLVALVGELKKENAALREKTSISERASQGPQETPGATEAATSGLETSAAPHRRGCR